MLLQSALRKMEINFKGGEAATIVKELIDKMETMYAAADWSQFELR